MERQKTPEPPLLVLLGALMILVPILAASGAASNRVTPEEGSSVPHRVHQARSIATAATISAPETPTVSRVLVLLMILLVAGGATADVLSGEAGRRRPATVAGDPLQATLRGCGHDGEMI